MGKKINSVDTEAYDKFHLEHGNASIIDPVAYERYRELVRKNPHHIFRTHYETFQEVTLKALQDKVNEFCDRNVVVNVDIKPHSFSQKGTMLCDRINPWSDTATVYIASIEYVVDITEKNARDEMENWILHKVKERFGDVSRSQYTYDVTTCSRISNRDAVVEYVKNLSSTDAYKATFNDLLEKYSLPKKSKNKG